MNQTILKGAIALALSTLTTLSAQAQTVRTEFVATDLNHPWALAFLPDGRFLVTERPGRMRIISANGKVGPALAGLPPVDASNQGGLLDVMLDSDFNQNRTLFFCFAEPGPTGNSTALARARLSDDSLTLEQVRVIFSQKPKLVSNAHFGCRIVESRANGQADGMLFMTLGDRYHRMHDAQTLDNHHGKIIRIRKDGSVPADNPFVKQAGALPEIWSYGHRNPQGLVLAPDGSLWAHEHGPQGGDEINLIQAGQNYGWPVITYGENYGGGKIGAGLSAKAGMQQPMHYWVPSIAPSGMSFVTSTRYGHGWVGNLLVGSLKFSYLNRIELAKPFTGPVRRESRLLDDERRRIRDVRQGPDGLIYVITDSPRSPLIRLLPVSAGAAP
ncbi:MAG: PQQ-dependent sugar dehydrogenase [Rhodoferax sp.]|jgi:glucose/arabinose dehydrogenase|uniref:PQQ-dependent sugar dehydrogenase n=1 Tax=Rhodoferax sp. TaxID=50421 RepID=UPI001B74A122|nr:PQQ-dependent sugar dehydrogenase [Rhodoferax sp.]MBP8286697.1 PQQ-dependent sugar dehydrogenase [Rhodoferax sp.]MBP9147144.1 PQQ-dependent sugar dehydrogenase [Rhodoferax sp.]MBP9736669.1 PQQ-dependent sugar dehydrogenase [Rhodoferax sp.]